MSVGVWGFTPNAHNISLVLHPVVNDPHHAVGVVGEVPFLYGAGVHDAIGGGGRDRGHGVGHGRGRGRGRGQGLGRGRGRGGVGRGRSRGRGVGGRDRGLGGGDGNGNQGGMAEPDVEAAVQGGCVQTALLTATSRRHIINEVHNVFDEQYNINNGEFVDIITAIDLAATAAAQVAVNEGAGAEFDVRQMAREAGENALNVYVDLNILPDRVVIENAISTATGNEIPMCTLKSMSDFELAMDNAIQVVVYELGLTTWQLDHCFPLHTMRL